MAGPEFQKKLAEQRAEQEKLRLATEQKYKPKEEAEAAGFGELETVVPGSVGGGEAEGVGAGQLGAPGHCMEMAGAVLVVVKPPNKSRRPSGSSFSGT